MTVAPEDIAPSDAPVGSFESFFEHERDRLYRALAVITGDLYEAEDVMQDAFARVWERWDRVRSLEDPVGYLYRTALNGFRLRLRTARRHLRLAPRGSERGDPFVGAERAADLHAALQGLTLRQRTALVLTGLLELTSDEAAGAMGGVSPTTVRRLAQTARSKIRGSLEEPDA